MDKALGELIEALVKLKDLTNASTHQTLLLQVMYFEAKGKLKEAEDLIAKMLSEHPDSHFALKRQVELQA